MKRAVVQPWLYRANRLYCRLWHRLVAGCHPLPDGPLILVGNHRSGVDPLLVQASVERDICFLMGRDYYRKLFWLRWLFRACGAIPVMPEGANSHAFAAAKRHLQAGGVLCIFPEGEAYPEVPLERLYPGAVKLAMETGAVIIPFRVSGIWPYDGRRMWRPFIRRGRASVRFGDPLHFPSALAGRAGQKGGIEMIRQALKALR